MGTFPPRYVNSCPFTHGQRPRRAPPLSEPSCLSFSCALNQMLVNGLVGISRCAKGAPLWIHEGAVFVPEDDNRGCGWIGIHLSLLSMRSIPLQTLPESPTPHLTMDLTLWTHGVWSLSQTMMTQACGSGSTYLCYPSGYSR